MIDPQAWAKKNKKKLTLIIQIATLLFMTLLVGLLFLGAANVVAETTEYTQGRKIAQVETEADKAVIDLIDSQKATEERTDPKTGVKITVRQPIQGKDDMKALIRRISKELGYSRPEWAIAVASCESGLNPKAVGDKGKSWGMWQIHQPSHPDVGQRAFDAEWSTRWSVSHLKAGRDSMWTCARILSK